MYYGVKTPNKKNTKKRKAVTEGEKLDKKKKKTVKKPKYVNDGNAPDTVDSFIIEKSKKTKKWGKREDLHPITPSGKRRKKVIDFIEYGKYLSFEAKLKL